MSSWQSFYRNLIVAGACALGLGITGYKSGAAQEASHHQSASPEVRARETEQLMTDDERLEMIYSLMPVVFPTGQREPRVPKEVPRTAGWSKGVKRLGVPDLLETDASLGIGNPSGGRRGDTATALPSGLALG